jgi:hypothetical protein
VEIGFNFLDIERNAFPAFQLLDAEIDFFNQDFVLLENAKSFSPRLHPDWPIIFQLPYTNIERGIAVAKFDCVGESWHRNRRTSCTNVFSEIFKAKAQNAGRDNDTNSKRYSRDNVLIFHYATFCLN